MDITCRKCKEILEIPDSEIGKKVKCPFCGNEFVGEKPGLFESVLMSITAEKPNAEKYTDEAAALIESAFNGNDNADWQDKTEKAARLFTKAGHCYETGDGATLDVNEALWAYVMAWQFGNRNLEEVLDRLAAKLDDKQLIALAERFLGADGEEEESSGHYAYAGLCCYYWAAERGNVKAMAKVGWLYAWGDKGEPAMCGVEQNAEEAKKWLSKAIEAGNVDSCFDLAVMLKDGRGCEPDYEGALKYFTIGANAGQVGCYQQLGEMYEKGLGVAADMDEAVKWYQKSADAGNCWGKIAMKRIQSGGELSQEEQLRMALGLS